MKELKNWPTRWGACYRRRHPRSAAGNKFPQQFSQVTTLAMQLIDRYLLKNFLWATVIFFATFCGLFTVIDAFGNLEEFINEGQRSDGLLAVLAKYYSLRSLVVFDRTAGVVMLVAAMFTLTSLERHNELTALMAAGISRGRLVKPIIGGVIGMTIFVVANREIVIPHFRQRLSITAQDFSGSKGQPVTAQYDHETDLYLSGRTAILAERRIERPHFRLPNNLAQYGLHISAGEAVYHDAETVDGIERPAGYLLRDVSQPTEIGTRPSLAMKDRPVLLLPSDTPWLEKDECFVVTEVAIEQIAGKGWRKFASTWEVIQALRSPSTNFGPDMRVSVHSRIVSPFLDLTLLFLGLPLVMSRESRNIFVSIGMCLGVVLGFFCVVIICQWLGNNCLITPAAAAWAPLAIFAPLAVLLSGPLRE